MKKNTLTERNCAHCEKSRPICGGELYICLKKGTVDPCGHCRSFVPDPLKIQVNVAKIPQLNLSTPIPKD